MSARVEGLRPELQILIIGARGRPGSESALALRRLLDMPVDWTYLTRIALEHGVANCLFANLLALEAIALPLDLRAAATAYLASERQHNAIFVNELFAILDALAARQIAAIPFKGPLLASLLYGDIGARSFRDLDFLLRPQSVSDAVEVLGTLGYDVESDRSPFQEAAFRRYAGQYVFLPRCGAVAPIEPHWALCPRTLAVALDYDGMWRRAIQQPLEQRMVPSLAPEDQLIALAVHGTKDEWAQLRLVCDVADFISVNPRLDWPAMFERARAQGLLRMLRLALMLARDVVGASLPDAAERALVGDRTAARLAGAARQSLLSGPRPVASIYAVSRFRLAVRERRRDRMRYLARTITTPRAIHFRMARLPPALFFLYYPIKLGHDYVALPLWLLRKRLPRLTAE